MKSKNIAQFKEFNNFSIILNRLVIGLVDSYGEYVIKYEYNSWGKLLNELPDEDDENFCLAARFNPFMYKGYCYDRSTKLYYCNSRYYSPELCRWISPDSIEYLDPESINGLNLYCYCLNNPIMCADPSGHSIIGAMIFGAAVGFLSVYVPDVIENGKDGFQVLDLWTFRNDNLLEYFVNTLGGALTGVIGELGMSFLISAPLVGALNTGVSYLSGDINTWQQGIDHFLQSTLLASLTLGSKNLSNKIPIKAKVGDLNTPLNNFVRNTIKVMDKTLYYCDQNVDNATEILLLLFGVRKAWKDLNSH